MPLIWVILPFASGHFNDCRKWKVRSIEQVDRGIGKSPIVLIWLLSVGEEMAQPCENAWFRQTRGVVLYWMRSNCV
jgi:hypothetical protein